MSTTPYRLAVIVGSTREGRFGPTVASWFTALAEQHGAAELDVIDVNELELPACHPNWGTERTPTWSNWPPASTPPTPSWSSPPSTTTATRPS